MAAMLEHRSVRIVDAVAAVARCDPLVDGSAIERARGGDAGSRLRWLAAGYLDLRRSPRARSAARRLLPHGRRARNALVQVGRRAAPACMMPVARGHEVELRGGPMMTRPHSI